MCGIMGFVAEGAPAGNESARAFTELLLLSESRGKEAAGAAFVRTDHVSVVRSPTSASELVRTPVFCLRLAEAEGSIHDGSETGRRFLGLGHSRLVTNGAQDVANNNQPVVKNGLVAVHNGIIVNVDALWREHPNLKREYEVDTEVFLAIAGAAVAAGSPSLRAAVVETFSRVQGATSVAVLAGDRDGLVIATNNGSLHFWQASQGHACAFASERAFLERLTRRRWFKRAWGEGTITHVRPGSGAAILPTGRSVPFDFGPESDAVSYDPLLSHARCISVANVEAASAVTTSPVRQAAPIMVSGNLFAVDDRKRRAVAALRRCTRCVLPETMPFISFDRDGVCNYCHQYQPLRPIGVEALKDLASRFKGERDAPDCVVMFSGGRDSSYGLHLTKTVLGLNPIAYTYDWGMVTDLARRNQMRLCGKLAVEHILVSADITRKRANIRRNVEAWLKQPDIGTVPLFMAGDKQYFYFANQIAKQNRCQLILLCENLLETTHFKSGFCGLSPLHGSKHTYTLSLRNKAKLAGYYAHATLKNPSYLNASLADTLWAFACYYAIPHPYLNVYEYIRWNEREIDDTLHAEYDWERATDTKSTWRIGDGTASFYNYIYYTIAGLTENDTFRSNQIREGALTREGAIILVERDNEPRYDSIQWYCETIGLDPRAVIETINRASKRYIL